MRSKIFALEPGQRRLLRLPPPRRCGRRGPVDGRADRGSTHCRRRSGCGRGYRTRPRPCATSRMARTASTAPLMPVGGRVPAPSAVSPRKSTSASMRLSMPSAAVKSLPRSASSTSCSPRGILREHFAVALDGVDRRAQIVPELGAVENRPGHRRALGQHRLQQANAANGPRSESARDREDRRRATARSASSIRISV